jgi:hypothetical protein
MLYSMIVQRPRGRPYKDRNVPTCPLVSMPPLPVGDVSSHSMLTNYEAQSTRIL